mmetsp:Transcript_27977/g.68125  ORF Transcript_27977/g.68125 Transcript_27977/m.68125 type:complete len:264 (-) Transcript_27977:511-1302(-)
MASMISNSIAETGKSYRAFSTDSGLLICTTRRLDSVLDPLIPIAAAVLRIVGSDGIYLFEGSTEVASASRSFDSSSSFGVLSVSAFSFDNDAIICAAKLNPVDEACGSFVSLSSSLSVTSFDSSFDLSFGKSFDSSLDTSIASSVEMGSSTGSSVLSFSGSGSLPAGTPSNPLNLRSCVLDFFLFFLLLVVAVAACSEDVLSTCISLSSTSLVLYRIDFSASFRASPARSFFIKCCKVCFLVLTFFRETVPDDDNISSLSFDN